VISTYLVALEDPAAPPRPDPAETADVRWFALDALPDRIAFPDYERPMIAAATELWRSGTAQPLLDRR
jgi:ADP-ribose pyrophosphatase YjhB (NUDIX family)